MTRGYFAHEAESAAPPGRAHHRVVIEIIRGLVRVVRVPPPWAHGDTPCEQRVPMDDADAGVVAGMVRRAIEGSATA